MNFTLTQVGDCKSGLEEIKTKLYNIVIFDIRLTHGYEKTTKGLDGYHLIQKVVPEYLLPEKVIILTILGREDAVNKMKELKIDINGEQIFSKFGLDQQAVINKIKQMV